MHPDAALPPEPLLLTEASVQEIQLELIRRWRYNEFDGRKVVASLRRHRSLLPAVFMDRLGFVDQDGSARWGLIKLRDLHWNRWNVETLSILTDTLDQARQWQQVAVVDDWQADTCTLTENADERFRQLGTSDPGFLIDFWWD